MAQDFTTRKQSWQQRFAGAVTDLLSVRDRLSALDSEWTAMQFATGAGGQPNPANITDSDAQATWPDSTALSLNQAVGAIAGANAIGATIDTNRGYLEPFRR